MPYIQFNDQRFPLTAAELTVGAYDGAGLRLPGDDARLRAVLLIGGDGTGIVRRGSVDATVFVNGVQLGAEPSPLLHGDKLSLGVYDLRYGDDVRGGSTQFVSSSSVPDAVRAKPNVPRKATTATGGRLVSLVDGREYSIPDVGVTFGREIGNDIVIASTEVSRKHATIAPMDGGYVVTDNSTNGLTVNGVRVEKSQRLGRADVLKIGPEEYRFYADVAKATETPSAGTAVEAAVSAASAPPPAPHEAPALVADSPSPAAHPAAVPAAPASPSPASRASERLPLATLEVINAGPMKGTKFELFTPLSNVGRGPHNDVALNDESVSDSHAKILKRDGSWWLVDQGSTNGSYVGGRRVQGEQQLVGAPDVRFGSVKMMFKSTPVPAEDDMKGTRAIASFGVEAAKKAAEKKRATKAALEAAEPAPLPAETKKGCMAMVAFLVTLGVASASMMAILLTIRG
ncbi:MAG: FHA domain-containing protein [Gemmatimonadaceae bacterium]